MADRTPADTAGSRLPEQLGAVTDAVNSTLEGRDAYFVERVFATRRVWRIVWEPGGGPRISWPESRFGKLSTTGGGPLLLVEGKLDRGVIRQGSAVLPHLHGRRSKARTSLVQPLPNKMPRPGFSDNAEHFANAGSRASKP